MSKTPTTVAEAEHQIAILNWKLRKAYLRMAALVVNDEIRENAHWNYEKEPNRDQASFRAGMDRAVWSLQYEENYTHTDGKPTLTP